MTFFGLTVLIISSHRAVIILELIAARWLRVTEFAGNPDGFESFFWPYLG